MQGGIMKNFSDYIKTENDKNENKINCENNNTAHLEDLIDKYSKYSKDNLLSEFMKLTIEKKKNGTLNEGELVNIKSALSPMLDDKQKEMLDVLIEMTKHV